jgi:hypothetical protein
MRFDAPSEKRLMKINAFYTVQIALTFLGGRGGPFTRAQMGTTRAENIVTEIVDLLSDSKSCNVKDHLQTRQMSIDKVLFTCMNKMIRHLW